MNRSLDGLESSFRSKVEYFIEEHKKVGVMLVISSTLRTTEEQVALFAQGRESLEVVNSLRKTAKLSPILASENKKTVTLADGVKLKSKHQLGKACDLWYANKKGNADWSIKDPVRIKSFGAIAKRFGMRWGGDFLPLDSNGIGIDPNHLEDV